MLMQHTTRTCSNVDECIVRPPLSRTARARHLYSTAGEKTTVEGRYENPTAFSYTAKVSLAPDL